MGRRQNPCEAHHHHGEEHHRADEGVGDLLRVRQAFEDRPDLQADQHEGQDVEHEHRRVPHRVGDDAGARRSVAGCDPRHRDREGDDGQHAGEMQMLGADPDSEGSHELQHDDARRVRDRAHRDAVGQRQHRPDDETAEDPDQEGWADIGHREGAGHGRRDPEPVNQQRARIVEEALAAQDGRESVRQRDVAQHRERRHGIGRRHDGAQHDAGGPGHVRHQPFHHQGHGGRRRHHRPEGEAGDGAPMGTQVPHRGIVAGVQQDGGQEQGQGQFRIEDEVRHRRNEGETDSPQRQEDRIGGADPAGEARQEHGAEQDADDPLENHHVGGNAPSRRRDHLSGRKNPHGQGRRGTDQPCARVTASSGLWFRVWNTTQ